jgi:sulfur-oxidizing protein SoxY
VFLDAPRRAEDAAVVPIGMRVNFTPDDKRTLQSLTLVIDENPAPVAGTFTIEPRSGATSISARIRVPTQRSFSLAGRGNAGHDFLPSDPNCLR